MLVFIMRLTAQQKKNLYYLVPLIVLLVGTLLFYFLAIRVKPNDRILTTSEGTALFANENPTFNIQFGEKDNLDGQWIRFEAKASSDNPFSSDKKKNIFTQIASIFTPNKKSGIEMSLRGVDFSETKKDGDMQYDQEVQKVADILGTDNVQTSTVLTSMGREIGQNDGDQNISKQTVVNQGVADGVDLEYQVLKGLGLKEEIVINDLEAYRKSCDDGCKLPLNEFVFDLKVDDGVVLKKGWFTVDGKSSEVYYFVDGNGKYLAHFLPSYAIDYSGNKTYEVNLIINEVKAGNYEAKVTVDSDWLLDPNRVYPIRIDPSIVHDDSTDFSTGIPMGTKYISGTGLKIADFSLVGSWNMNETANGTCSGGGDICDQSGNNYNATITGTATSVAAYEGLGRDFDGVTGTYASLGDLTAFEVQSFTIEAYAKKEGTCGPYNYCTIMSKGGTGTKGFGFAIYGGKLHLRINDLGTGSTQFLTGATTLSDNVWYYVAVSVDGVSKTISLYLNGNLEATGKYTDTISYSTENVKFGNSNNGNDLSMNGVLDSVRFWSVAKDANYIKNSYLKYGSSVLGTYTSSSLNLGSSVSGITMSWLNSGVNTGNGETPYSTTGMVAQWNFNETSGTSAVSGGTCGTSCNGTLTNMTTTGQDAAAMTGWTANNRRWGTGAVMFDGSNDFVSVPTTLSALSTNDRTIEVWVNTSSTTNQIVWWSQGSTSNPRNYVYVLSTGKVRFNVRDDSGNEISAGVFDSTKTINDGLWHFISAVWDNANNAAYIYIDGRLDNSVTGLTTISTVTDTSTKNIGASGTPAEYFKGMIDSTRIYSRALSANEILSNYQSGNIEFQYRTSTDNSTWSNWTSYNDGALMFDGNDDYVNVGDIATVDALTSFSTCAWVNNDTLTTDSMIWSKVDNSTWSGIMFVKDIVGQVSGRTNVYKIWVGQNSAAAYIEGATNSATTGAWQQVCATFTANSATGLRLYVNGVEDANSPVSTVGITGLDAGTNSLTIGKYNNGTSYVDGSIDNIQIYNRVLAGSEMTSNYTVSDFETPYSSTGLLAFWKFNELSGTTAVSGGTCGVACNGTLTNFASTTARDSSTTSGWTAKTKRGSDYPEYSFDNPYLYKTDDTGLVAYWPMNEASGSGAYIKDVSTPFAVGGLVTYSGGYTIHTFKTSDMFTVNGSGNVETLVVAGGGGGGDGVSYTDNGGGGGAGGVIYNSSFALTSQAYSISVGSGGLANANGNSSTFSTITASGGGKGGKQSVGGNGGSGGGGSSINNLAGGSATPSGQGNSGGAGARSGYNGGGGGGGAGAVGATGVTALGGAGIAYSISGSSVFYAGGGSAGNDTARVNGGIGGGGSGAVYTDSSGGGAGTPNTGGGGGGGASRDANVAGGAGGSGIVIVRYPSSYTSTTVDTIGDLTPTGTTYVGGKSGGARSFNGSSDVLSCTDANCGGAGKLDVMTGSISISAWVKPATCSTVSVSPGIIDKFDTATSKGYLIYNEYYSGANVWTFYDPVNNSYARSTTPCSVGVWTYITAVYDSSASTKKMYINGKLEATLTSQSPMGDSGSDFNIGRYRNAGYYYNGIMDEVRIFNTALSATAIMSDYTNGIPNKSNTISQSGSSLKLEGAGSAKLTSGAYVVDTNTVGLWHMDERSGTGAYIKDSTANANNGTPTGTTYTNSGKIGGARSFNGSSDRIALSAGSNANITGDISYEAWIKPTSFATVGTLIHKDSQYSIAINTSGYVAWADSSNWNYAAFGYQNIGLATGVWQHIAVTKSGSTVTIYLNGVYKFSQAFGSAITGTSNIMHMGCYSDATTCAASYYNGQIDEVRMSNIARTANEIAESYKLGKDSYINQTLNTIDLSTKNTMAINVASDRPGTYLSTIWGESAFANYQPDANTAGLWHIDEISGSGAYIKDVSSYGNNGTPTGTTYTNSGKLGGARSFNGSSDVFKTGTNSSLNINGTLTLSAWIKASTDVTNYRMIISKEESATIDPYRLYLASSTGIPNFSDMFTNGGVAGTIALNDDKWHYIVVTRDDVAKVSKMYIDGKLNAQGATYSGTNPLATSTETWIGKTPYSDRFPFFGTIDEVRVDNTARSADQIRQAYEVGLRTHNITVTFGAGLASGNLITGSGDYSFSIDATKYGLPALGSELYVGDKVVVKENYDGTEYIAQGTVSAVTASTGAVTVSSWDSGATFPSGGYTVNADVFKWQKEYISVKNRTISTQVDATNLLTFRLNDGNEGRNIWIDDLRSSTGYLKNSASEAITFASNAQYAQYKAILTSWDSNVTPYISQVQIDYTASGPTIDQLMRHGMWFDSSGAKQNFWWVGTH